MKAQNGTAAPSASTQGGHAATSQKKASSGVFERIMGGLRGSEPHEHATSHDAASVKAPVEAPSKRQPSFQLTFGAAEAEPGRKHTDDLTPAAAASQSSGDAGGGQPPRRPSARGEFDSGLLDSDDIGESGGDGSVLAGGSTSKESGNDGSGSAQVLMGLKLGATAPSPARKNSAAEGATRMAKEAGAGGTESLTSPRASAPPAGHMPGRPSTGAQAAEVARTAAGAARAAAAAARSAPRGDGRENGSGDAQQRRGSGSRSTAAAAAADGVKMERTSSASGAAVVDGAAAVVAAVAANAAAGTGATAAGTRAGLESTIRANGYVVTAKPTAPAAPIAAPLAALAAVAAGPAATATATVAPAVMAAASSSVQDAKTATSAAAPEAVIAAPADVVVPAAAPVAAPAPALDVAEARTQQPFEDTTVPVRIPETSAPSDAMPASLGDAAAEASHQRFDASELVQLSDALRAAKAASVVACSAETEHEASGAVDAGEAVAAAGDAETAVTGAAEALEAAPAVASKAAADAAAAVAASPGEAAGDTPATVEDAKASRRQVDDYGGNTDVTSTADAAAAAAASPAASDAADVGGGSGGDAPAADTGDACADAGADDADDADDTDDADAGDASANADVKTSGADRDGRSEGTVGDAAGEEAGDEARALPDLAASGGAAAAAATAGGGTGRGRSRSRGHSSHRYAHSLLGDTDSESDLSVDGEFNSSKRTDRFGFFETSDRHGADLPAAEAARRAGKEEERGVKWAKMRRSWGPVQVRYTSQLKRRVRKGVPNAVRGEVWQLLSGAKAMQEANVGRYRALLQSDVAVDGPIEEDLPRTMYDNEMFCRHSKHKGRLKLRRVLVAYGRYDREVQYCQGINYICALFLLYMPEEEAFWQLVCVMNRPAAPMRELFLPGMVAAQEFQHVMDSLADKYVPRLCRQIGGFGLTPSMYATQWFLTGFTQRFPYEFVTRVWDVFLLEDWKVMYRVCLALFRMAEPAVAGMEIEPMNLYLRDLPTAVDGDAVLAVAFSIRLKHRHIEKRRRAFWDERGVPLPGSKEAAAVVKAAATAAPPAATAAADRVAGAAATPAAAAAGGAI